MPFLAPLVTAIGGAFTAASQFVAGVAGSLGFGATAATAIGNAVVQFGASFLINSAISAVFGKKPKAQDVAADLAQPSTAPSHRFVYGECRATGTPAGTPVKGEYIYGAWILNSRPSDLSSFSLYLDKREVVLTGNAFDLAGAGATATEDPFSGHCTVWMSRGDHTAPPTAFTTEAPWVDGVRDDLWKATDAWKGRTMIWLKLRAGGSGERQERWPSTPPLVEVEGKWSLICDPRNVLHDQDDPSTWEWTDNHALCVRDALMQNPVRQYRAGQIHPSFDADGPDACDETVTLNSGGSEPRYTCAGTVVWTDGEIEDQLNPMMISGAADFIRVGGKLGYAAGVYRAPTETMTYLLGDSFEFPDMIAGSELVNRLRVTYLSPARGYETAELTPWDIPGALTEDGGVPAVKTLDLPFCASATQAMRVRKITGLRLRRQESIQGGTLPPEAFNLVGGATVNIALPAPYDALDGVYEIGGIHPGMDPIGESGEVAMRMPASLVKHSATIYAWTPATDEEAVYNEQYDSTRTGVGLPGALSVDSGGGIDLNTGGTIIPRFLFKFDPASTDADYYEWQWRLDGDEYQTGGSIDAENVGGDGKMFFYLNVASITEPHDVRVRTFSQSGRSGFVELTGAIYALDLDGVAGTAGLGFATFTGTGSASEAANAVRVYYGAEGSAFVDATNAGTTSVAPGASFTVYAGDQTTTNLFDNADFASDTIWDKGTGWDISGGKANKTGTVTASITQALALDAGDVYRFGFTVSGRTAGIIGPRITGTSSVFNVTGSVDGVYALKATAPAAPTAAGFTAANSFDGSIDDVAVFKETPSHLPQGALDFWLVPVTVTGVEGTPSGPITLTIF